MKFRFDRRVQVESKQSLPKKQNEIPKLINRKYFLKLQINY